MPRLPVDLTWITFDQAVQLARRTTWRVTRRETAAALLPDGRLQRWVRPVIDPGDGPAFAADTSHAVVRPAAFADDPSDVSAFLAVHAVQWLPDLATEAQQARDLLAQVDELLARPTVAARFDGRLTPQRW